MEYAKIKASGNQLQVLELHPITAGTVGARVDIQFDESWDGLSKTLVWRGSGTVIDDINCTGKIPPEVLRRQGSRLHVGVYGTKDGTVLPTVWADLGIILPGADPSGDESAEPTLPVWAQIPAFVENELQKAKDSGQFDGPKGDRGDPGRDGYTPIKGVDYFDGEKGEPGQVNLDDSSVAADSTWSSRAIADRLCPKFSDTGPVVTCQPVAGYPMTVQTEPGAARVTRCGKNSIDPAALIPNKGELAEIDGDVVRATFDERGLQLRSPLVYPAGVYTVSLMPVTETANMTVYIRNAATDEQILAAHMGSYDGCMAYTVYSTQPFYLEICRRYTADASAYGAFSFRLQLEQGPAATEYTPGQGGVFEAGQPVPALAGTNILWADRGSITVTGAADPAAVIEKLTNAIIALGGNL